MKCQLSDRVRKESFFYIRNFHLGKENSYVTFDTNIKYKVNDGLEIYGGIKNLLDKEYATFVTANEYGTSYGPADGRSYYAGFRYNF